MGIERAAALYFGFAKRTIREGLHVAKQRGRWVQVRALTAGEKAGIAAACDRFIAEKLKPRFLPEIRRTQFNYPVDIFGAETNSASSYVIGRAFPTTKARNSMPLSRVSTWWRKMRRRSGSTSCGIGTPGSGGACILPSRSKKCCN